MKRLIAVCIFLLIGFSGRLLAINSISPVDQIPAPTLVPPTRVPQPESGELEILPSESTVARIQANGAVKVGILYNAPPFGELNIRGDVTGYDADLAGSMAETWGVEIEFVQVTRQEDQWASMLRNGEVDMVVAARVHQRELDAVAEFSDTYYRGEQSVMVRAEDEAAEPANLANRRFGVVIDSRAQDALNSWLSRNGVPANIQTYLTLDRAYVALVAGEVDGVVDSRYRLLQVSIQRPELTRILDSSIQMEPFAIAMLRQDTSLRDLVNRTLQYLAVTERMKEIHQTYFPGETYDVVSVWANLGEEAPTPSQYPTTLSFPAAYAIPRIQSGAPVRVAGLIGVTADSDAPESERRLDAFHRALLQEMVSRWGATVEFVPDSATNALELVAAGQAEIAIGVEPDWAWTDRVDFTGEYLLHGERLMIRVDSDITGFADLSGGKVVITPANEPDAAGQAVEIAETVNARIEIDQEREQDLGFVFLNDDEVDAEAVFGDSLKLIPHVQQNPEQLRLLLDESGNARWYSRDFLPLSMNFAVPENDLDFRLLVEYTLQELARDGTLNSLLQPLMLQEDIPQFEIWPGPSAYLSFSLASR
jgi:polar amino acid transport system substrate-binding protein